MTSGPFSDASHGRTLASTLAVLVMGVATGCATAPMSRSAPRGVQYTLVNLHPDDTRSRLYSVNYQRPSLLPRCTKVQIVQVTENEALFEISATGRRYSYYRHSSLREPFEQHLARYFGPTCDEARLAAMSQIDRDGIAQGRALVGMTKESVILAIGYPPEGRTPSVDADVWTYWKSRFRTFQIHFGNGKIARITE